MKGSEHYRDSERNIQYAKDSTEGSAKEAFHLEMAKVHAILSASVALSNLVTVWGDIAAMMRADAELADAEPVSRAEPLVTCNAAPADDGPERCGLPIGHEGMHEGNGVGWMTYVPPAYQTTATVAQPIYQSTATDMNLEMPR